MNRGKELSSSLLSKKRSELPNIEKHAGERKGEGAGDSDPGKSVDPALPKNGSQKPTLLFEEKRDCKPDKAQDSG
jgi:hypothetical protein